ncbi:MAG: LptA/OstA family protein [Trueperaceae bacterium]
MRRLFILLALLFLLVVLAQEQTENTDTSTEQTTESEETTGTEETAESEESTEEAAPEQTEEEKRIIRIVFDGGTEEGDFRFGPLTYAHPEPEGIIGTVSNLTIYGQNAVLSGPEGEDVPLTEAEGRRNAAFSGGVRVTRNRLEAKGPDLGYNEETGIGSLTGNVTIVVAPEEEGDDPVNITAESADFDVDTDVSTSRGNVEMVNGNQTAQAGEVVFEEEREIARMTTEGGQVTLTRIDENGETMTITADMVRPSTGTQQFHAIGNVTVIDGASISTGDEVFFNDEESRAEIIGSPASYENEDEGVSFTSARIEQFTDTNEAEPFDETMPSQFNPDDFKLLEELEPSEGE